MRIDSPFVLCFKVLHLLRESLTEFLFFLNLVGDCSERGRLQREKRVQVRPRRSENEQRLRTPPRVATPL